MTRRERGRCGTAVDPQCRPSGPRIVAGASDLNVDTRCDSDPGVVELVTGSGLEGSASWHQLELEAPTGVAMGVLEREAGCRHVCGVSRQIR